MRNSGILIFIIIVLFSCGIITQKKNSKQLTTDEPSIFIKSDGEIINDIEIMFKERPEIYERFLNKSIVLNLFCDTLTCEIDSIVIDNNRGFHEYSKILIEYFSKMSPINCKHSVLNRNISVFDILVANRTDETVLDIGYGYKVIP